MNVIIAGSRSITDPDIVAHACAMAGLEGMSITEVVSGHCPDGVDSLGEDWADEMNLPVKTFPAKWRVNGKLDRGAGYKRNAQMAKYADAAIVIWDGKSKGSKNMIDLMINARKPLLVWLLNSNSGYWFGPLLYQSL